MKKNIIAVICIIATISACGGRKANPISTMQFGDENKSCKSINYEMTANQQEIDRLIPETDKTAKNVALAVTGWFLIVPWFFMDLSKAEEQEISALRKRNDQLAAISINKNCSRSINNIDK